MSGFFYKSRLAYNPAWRSSGQGKDSIYLSAVRARSPKAVGTLPSVWVMEQYDG
jgi:hypothetical protein